MSHTVRTNIAPHLFHLFYITDVGRLVIADVGLVGEIFGSDEKGAPYTVLFLHPSIIHRILEGGLGIDVVGNDEGRLLSVGDFWNERSEVKYKTTLKDGLLGIHLKSNDISPTVSFVVEDSAKVEEIKVFNKRGGEIKYQEIRRGGKVFLRRGK